MTDIAAIADSLSEAQRKSWECGVVFGQVPWHDDKPSRFMCSQYRPSDGDPQTITIGIYLGDSRWAQGEFSVEEAAICAALILSKPAVRDHLKGQDNEG